MARFERYGVLGTESGGIFFTEATLAAAQPLGSVTATSDRQNIPLDALKEQLARQVRAKGGNVLHEFSYAQKATVRSFSSTRLTAKGVAGLME